MKCCCHLHVDYIVTDVPSQKVLGLNLLVNCLYFHFKLIYRDNLSGNRMQLYSTLLRVKIELSVTFQITMSSRTCFDVSHYNYCCYY